MYEHLMRLRKRGVKGQVKCEDQVRVKLKIQVRVWVVKDRLKRFGYGEKEQDTRVPLCEKMIDLRMAYGLWQQNQERERVLWGRSPISNNCFYNHKP